MEVAEFGKYLYPIKRWWWLILLSALVAGVSTYFYTSLRPAVYQSTASVMVGSSIQDPNPDNTQLNLTQSLAHTYADMAGRTAVRDAVMTALGTTWLPNYTVSVSPDSSFLEIVVTDTDPKRAQAVAGEIVNQLIRLSPLGQESLTRNAFVKEQLAKLESSIRSTEDEITQKNNELGTALAASKIREIEDQIQALTAKLTSLQNNYALLLSSTQKGAVNAINMLEPPLLPERPISNGRTQLTLLAALLGALLATAGAYLIEFLDDRIRTVNQVQDIADLTTLATIPVVPMTEKNPTSLVMIDGQQSGAAESFRILRTNLQFASVDRALRLLQITSPNPGDGKSYVAANVAVAMAQAGRNVILVDADLRKPSQHRIFGLVNNVGVTTALIGAPSNLASLLRTTEVDNLRVMTAGPLPPNPSELLASRRLKDLMHTLMDECDIVVLDTPPVTVVSDTTVVASEADGVLLVIRAAISRRDALKHSAAALRQVQAHILGVVLNGTGARDHGYHYAYDSKYGYHYYQNKAAAKARSSSRKNQKKQPPAAARSDGALDGRGALVGQAGSVPEYSPGDN